MLPINIYALTRISKIASIQKLERQMSRREQPLVIKKWEIQSLKRFSEHLQQEFEKAADLNFYYSFQIPKLGKEFDLLRISDEFVINIELKSREVSDENIKKQLLQNRYYLAALGKTVRSYTYISSTDRLIRLTNSGKLIESDWDRLCKDIQKQEICYEEHIDILFKEDNYLISPFTDIERFLNREYFLTFQQKDIKTHILKKIDTKQVLFQGFTGLPGTGKTLLMYDLALKLSHKQKVCVLHFGTFPAELEQMNSRLKRIDFYQCNTGNLPELDSYAVIFIDEGHQVKRNILSQLKDYVVRTGKPIIISYDMEDAISMKEQGEYIVNDIRKLPGYIEYKLTNRIRMNSELSSFIHCMMNMKKYRRRNEYPSVSLSYANNNEEMKKLLATYVKNGYTYIRDERIHGYETENKNGIKASVDICMEFDKVVMLLDESFQYDEEGYLRTVTTDAKCEANAVSVVRNLFHGLNRAKTGIAIIVLKNEEVFERLLFLL